MRATVLKQSKLDLNVEDYAHLFICFCSGGVTASLNMDFIRHDYTRNCKVIGEKGTIRWDATSGLVEIWKQNECSWKTIFENSQAKEETYHSEWKAFLQAVQYKRSAGANLEDGLAVLKIIDAARLSDRNGGKKVYI